MEAPKGGMSSPMSRFSLTLTFGDRVVPGAGVEPARALPPKGF